MDNYTQLIHTARQVAKITNLTSSQVAQIGQFIVPYSPANGKGYRTGYSFRNVVEVSVVSYLIKFGVPRKRIQKYLNDLMNSKFGWLEDNELSGWIVLDDKWRWAAGSTPNEALEILIHGGSVHTAITLDVGLIKKEVREKIEEVNEVKNGRAGNSYSDVAEGNVSLS